MRGMLVALALCTLVAIPVASAQRPPRGPSSISITASQTMVTYGGSVRIAGRLRGRSNRNRTVGLEHNPHPFAAMVPLARTRTDRNGNYSFTVRTRKHTRYRAVMVDISPYETRRVSREVLVRSRLRVGVRLSDSTPRRGQRVRFSGSVLPKHDGHLVYVQRRRRDGRWVSIARTRTAPATGNRSRYVRRVRIRRSGLYRVRVRGHSDHSTGFSRRRAIRVH